VPDRPLEFPDPSQPGGVWRPKNFSGAFLNRSITLRYALDLSLNLPAIYTAHQVGVEKVAEKLAQAGFAVRYPTLAIAIGGASITPLDLAAAYAAFVNGGYRVAPIFVARVEDARGEVLYRATPERRLLFDPLVAYQGWDLLKGYVYDLGEKGLAKGARIPGRVVGGKTGTTNEARDLWFAGVTRGLSAVVWVGRDDNRPLRMGGREPSSSVVNPPIWRDFVAEALRGRPGQDFPLPPGLVRARVDLLSGYPSAEGVEMVFPEGKAPAPRLPRSPPRRRRGQGPRKPHPRACKARLLRRARPPRHRLRRRRHEGGLVPGAGGPGGAPGAHERGGGGPGHAQLRPGPALPVNPAPRVGPPWAREAYWLAVHAEEILDRAVAVDSLMEALADVQLVVATTGRPRELYPAPVVPAWEVPARVLSVEGEVALVFGRETFGLTNEELALAHVIGTIPTAPEQPSLNLAQAVVVFAYELFKAVVGEGRFPREELAQVAALEAFFEDLGRYVLEIGFTDQNRFPHAMRRLRRIFHKARLTPGEVQMLRGLLHQSRYQMRKKDG
jgi:TrmH family RNA methyltransferase